MGFAWDYELSLSLLLVELFETVSKTELSDEYFRFFFGGWLLMFLAFSFFLVSFSRFWLDTILQCIFQNLAMDFQFQRFNFLCLSRNGFFLLLHFVFQVRVFFCQQAIFCYFASRFSKFGPKLVVFFLQCSKF